MAGEFKLLPLKPSAEEREELVGNIISVYRQATPRQRERGKAWYPNANDIARIIGADVRVGAGMLAVLSAQRQWLETIKLAQQAAQVVDVKLDGKQLKTMRDQEEKVKRIMAGEDPLEVLPQGLKTWNFYLCIVDPNHPSAVVVDRHAHDIARGRIFGDRPRGLSARTRYDLIADAYREAARRLKVKPLVVQAVTWVVWTEMLVRAGRPHRGFSG
jgi:hypothetical protein